jgi:hypothetical protein
VNLSGFSETEQQTVESAVEPNTEKSVIHTSLEVVSSGRKKRRDVKSNNNSSSAPALTQYTVSTLLQSPRPGLTRKSANQIGSPGATCRSRRWF